MSELPLWGTLQKAQDDSETIEEAIARLISDHNDDPTAHLGTGQSLEQHKSEDVIDHPPGSLLADKSTMSELAVRILFQSLAGWTYTGSVDITDGPSLYLYIEDGATEESRIWTSPQVPANFLNSAYNMVFQALLKYSLGTTDYESYFGFFSGTDSTPDGFGFVVEGGTLYGHAKNGATQHRTSAISVDVTEAHIYRAYLDSALETVSFFVDGVAVGSVDVSDITFETDSGPSFWLKNTDANDGYLYVPELYYSRQL